ncbi:50S ribosomal protein L11 methyltransferase [Clostridia bacterium]|nr:50S ribosomal protein L11 methyltransferase [Clostridia bacterium]
MKWEEITVNVGEEAKDAVINLFYEAGANGVVIEDTKTWETYEEEGLWDVFESPQEVLDAENVLVKGYLPDDEFLRERLRDFRLKLELLSDYFTDYNADLSLKKIEDEDWETNWKGYYKTEKIGERIVISPSWENYEAKEEELVIKLDPGMAFGTGKHPTTEHTLRFMEKYIKPGDKIIDAGCGSGILSIAATKLGASKVLAVDNDPTAIKIAKRNVLENGADGEVEVCVNDLLTAIQGTFDVIVGNLIADLIVVLLPQAKNILRTGGLVIVSGILDKKIKRVEDSMSENGFEIIDQKLDSEWYTLVGRKI